MVEHRNRNTCDTVLTGQPFSQSDIAEIRTDRRVVRQLKVGPRGAREAEARTCQQIAEQITLGLVEGWQLCYMLGMRSHEIGQRPLQWRDAGKADVLVHLAQLTAERGWRHHVSGLPAGDMVGLAKGTDDEGPLIQFIVPQYTGVLTTVEYQVLVNLITCLLYTSDAADE